MSKILAIKGHPTRGNEIITLLEMLGGYTDELIDNGTDKKYAYFIVTDENNAIDAFPIDKKDELDFEAQIFTLEEFLEKFPFKVGDFVRIPEYESEVRICKMKWCPLSEHVEYMVCPNDEDEWFTANELLEDNDNPNEMTDCKKCGLVFGSVRCFDKDCPNNTPKDADKSIFTIGPVMVPDKVDDKLEYEIVAGYEFDKIENGKIILKPIKFEYPKTYEECCEVLNYCGDYFLTTYDNNGNPSIISNILNSINILTKLLICRDAYWKIAGEEMGLDKPWEPDWNHVNRKHYCIYNSKNNIVKNVIYSENKILAFPTEELRDMFYENFKNEIEQCKELL